MFVRLWVPFPVVAFLLVAAALEQTRQTRLGADADRSDRLRYIEMLESVMLGLWLCSTALDSRLLRFFWCSMFPDVLSFGMFAFTSSMSNQFERKAGLQ